MTVSKTHFVMFLPEYIGGGEESLGYEHGVPRIPVLTGKLIGLHFGSHFLLDLSTVTTNITVRSKRRGFS
jgi:hypothetical protein